MKPLGILILVVLIPVVIISAVLWGTLCFVVEFLDFVKSYFDFIKKEIEG